jgi:hypothetical protein
MTRIKRWLGARRAPLIVLVIGIALAAPALTADFTADDHVHRVVTRADPGIPGLHSRTLDLFTFANGDPADTAQLVDAGVFPWWTDPHLRLAFWRPVSSVTHALDHALWPDSAPAQLAHNLLWHALALLVVWLLFRRLFPPGSRWIAVLALALYAFDDARGPVVGWVANRNALVALVLAIPALLAHDRWRRDGWTPGRWVGPLVFALALGAGESAIALLAYLAAHALWLDRGAWRSRLLALAPYLVIVVGWKVIYAQLGYGVAGSGIYFDPGADPAGFLGAATTRIPFLLQGALALPWSDVASFYPVLGIVAPMLAIGVGVLAAIGLACARLLRRDPLARFFATGMILAVIPVASTFPADRLLSFVSIGALGLVAQLVAAALGDRVQLGDGRVRRIACVVVASIMILVHLVLAPPLLVLRARSMVAVARVLDRADAGIPPAANGKTVLIVNTPSDALAAYIQIMRASRRLERPAHVYWLATATTAVRVERTDDRTLRVTPDGGALRFDIDRMMRTPRSRPFHAGDRVALTNVTVEVSRVTPDGRPAELLAHFAIPLDDPSLVWLRWDGKTYAGYTPPAIGKREMLPAVDFLKLLED